MAWTGPVGATPYSALGGSHAALGPPVPSRARLRLETVDSAGLCFLSWRNAGKLLLLHHDRPSCRSSAAGSSRTDPLPHHIRPAQARRVPPNRHRRNRVVLAHHGFNLAGFVRSACFRAVVPGSPLKECVVVSHPFRGKREKDGGHSVNRHLPRATPCEDAAERGNARQSSVFQDTRNRPGG